MTKRKRWSDRALARMQRIPLLRRLPREVQDGMLRGAAITATGLLVVGGVLGSLNRGPSGTLIGAISGALLGLMLGAFVGAVQSLVLSAHQARAEVSIELESGEGRYAPGETLSGYVQISAGNSFRLDGGTLYLLCRGFFLDDRERDGESGSAPTARGSRQYVVQQQEVVPAGDLRRGSSTRHPFSFVLPTEAPPTHHGYACVVRWTLHAVLDAPGDEPVTGQQELYVETPPFALSVPLGGYRSSISDPACELGIHLPRVVCAEGESLRADVRITPMESFRADEVRALLLRIENTPEGSSHTVYVSHWDPDSGLFRGERLPGGQGTTYVWLEDEALLGGPIHFEIAEPVTFSCMLAVPTQWRPTLGTKDGRVTWKAGIIVARPDGSSARVFHEIIVHTGASRLSEALAPA